MPSVYFAINNKSSAETQCWTWSGLRIAIQPDSEIQNRIRIGQDFEKNSTASDMDIQTALITAVKCLIKGFFEYKPDWIKYFWQVYRALIGPDYSMKILDWIRIAKISNFFNTLRLSCYSHCIHLCPDSTYNAELLFTPSNVNVVEVLVSVRDDHYPVCRLDIRQDSQFATVYGSEMIE